MDEMLDAARLGLRRVEPDDLEEMVASGAVVVDIRTVEQRKRDGEMPGAHVIDLTVLEWRLAPSSRHRALDLDPDRPLILVCSQGYSSSLAAARLQQLGLPEATDLVGGFHAWKSWVEAGD